SEKTIPEKVERHGHDFFEIDLVLSGSGVNHVRGKEFPFEEGDLLLASPRDIHEVNCRSGTRILGLKFQPSIFPNDPHLPQDTGLSWSLEPFSSSKTDFRFRVHPAKQEPAEIAKMIQGEYLGGQKGWERSAAALLEALLILIRREMGGEGENGETLPRLPADGLFFRILEYLGEHFSENPDLGTMARLFEITPNYLSRYFAERAGVPFKHFVIQKRLQRARDLLASTDLSIVSVAQESGFGDLSVFNRQFRRAFQTTPKAFRVNSRTHSTGSENIMTRDDEGQAH
ncbi:MAG: helix-turn-helix domain-containing protein, partial [Spirochaetia bacterium]|nr:helix-turn-helix domain-containing protein [Spirochaetia bacterium]